MTDGTQRCLAAHGLSHWFPGGSPLFADLSFELGPGATVAVVGPSGSGKSTLLGILAGWIEPRAGSVARRGIGEVRWVFQSPHGLPGRTALDHVVLPLLAAGLTRTQAEPRALSTMEQFDLVPVAQSRFRELSGGEAQRLMLARSMAALPDLLLVDEPTAQLDASAARGVNEALAGYSRGSSIVVVATHDPQTRDACDTAIDLRAVSGSRASGR